MTIDTEPEEWFPRWARELLALELEAAGNRRRRIEAAEMRRGNVSLNSRRALRAIVKTRDLFE
jgi:hypothetical protein